LCNKDPRRRVWSGNWMTEKLLVVLTTCESMADAEQLAGSLVEKRLAACVSIGAEVLSIYPWEGRVDKAAEVPLMIKTCRERLGALKTMFAERHPYDVPEMLVLPVTDGLDAYFDWARDWLNPEPK